jgi:two-component system, LytTR family, response regulator
MLINCAIVEDDPIAAKTLVRFIQKTPFLTLINLYTDPEEAAKELNVHQPELLFLDIMMPGLTGIDLLKRLVKKPLVIFTTGKSEFALTAYELDVFDYLLKPVIYPRFRRAVQKAKEKIDGSRIYQLPSTSLFLKTSSGFLRVNMDDVSYIEKDDDGVRVVTTLYRNDIIGTVPIGEIENQLPEGKFVKVNRDTIVNIDKVSIVNQNNLLVKGISIPIEQEYKHELLRFLAV